MTTTARRTSRISPPRRVTLAAAGAAAALVLAGCAADDPAGQAGTEPTADVQTEEEPAEPVVPAEEDGSGADSGAGTDATVGDQDVEFAQMMIVHHEGALEMAELAQDRAEDDEVRDLAGRIRAAQDPEISAMEGWLEAWGEERSPGDHGRHGHGDDGSMLMDGMEHGEAMTHLDGLSGAEFDRRFLELMIDHHRGAVVMSQAQLDDGLHPEARELAQQIIADQEAEIEEMEELLSRL
jgi:uncharacterized protein (DUF305 family)